MMEIRTYGRPRKGCKMVASDKHHTLKEFDYIGEVLSVVGNIVAFKDRNGDTDYIIWNFKEGPNDTISFGA